MLITDGAQLNHLRTVADLNAMSIEEFVLPESRHVLAGNTRLHYLDWGGNSHQHVLFLHGGALTAHTWDLICLSLRSDYHCLALDLRGHGDSEWSPGMDYSISTHGQDVEQFVDALGLERVVVIGMSRGGLVGIELAARQDDLVDRLVLVDVGPEIRTLGTDRIRAFVRQPAELHSVDAFVERALQFNPRRNRDLLRTSVMHNLRELPDGTWTWKYDRRHFGRWDHMFDAARRDLAGRLPLISCPTLVVRGEMSDVFTVEDAENVVARLPNGRWVSIPRAGHTVQGDNPAQLVLALREFLEG